MTFVGKILVVVICVMSVCFMGFAVAVYSTQTNWREKYQQQQSVLNETKEQYDNLQTDLAQTEETLQRRIQEQNDDIGSLQAEIESKDRQLEELDQQIAQIRREAQDATQQAEIALREGESRREEAERLRAQLKNVLLEKDEAVKNRIDLQDDLFQVSGELERVEKRNKQLVMRVAELESLARRYDIPMEETQEDILANPPQVEGVVLQTNFEAGAPIDGERLMEISIGSDDGLLSGHQLHAWHPGVQAKYLGPVEVVETYPNRSVARVLGRFKVERNDRVTTRFK